MTCPLRQHRECSCTGNHCKARPYDRMLRKHDAALVERRHTEMWLAIGIAVIFGITAVVGANALMRVERQHEIQARV